MLYWYTKSVTADKSESEANDEIFNIDTGVITQWIIIIPAGSVGLLHFQVRYRNVQLMPRNREGNIKGNKILLNIPDSYVIPPTNPVLRIRSWNTDTQFPHEFTVGVNVLPIEEVFWYKTLTRAINRLSSLLRGKVRL